MKSTLLFAALFLALFAYSVSAIPFTGSLAANTTYAHYLGSLPDRPSGLVKISLSIGARAELCIQEGFALTGDLSGCNAGGYFLFDNSGSNANNFFSLESDELSLFDQTYQDSFVGDANLDYQNKTASLRGGVDYYFSMRLNQSNVNTTSFPWSLFISYDSVGCPNESVGLSDGTCTTAPLVTKKAATYTAAPQSTDYYSLDVSNNGLNASSLIVTILLTDTPKTLISNIVPANSNDSISASIRRGAVPYGNLSDATAVAVTDTIWTITVDSPVTNQQYFLEVTNNQKQTQSYSVVSLLNTCPANLFGPNCTNSTDLTNDYNATMYTGNGEYKYFHLTSKTTYIGVGTEKLDDPAPVLLVSILNYPSNDSAQVTISNNTINFYSADYNTTNDINTTYVAVYAYEGQEYYIWANTPCANNCAGDEYGTGNSTHGTCNKQTGYCDCDKGYGNLSCSKTGLKLVWIIVIVIVCIIILAIAIGVPVACFLRNRRRARYERV